MAENSPKPSTSSSSTEVTKVLQRKRRRTRSHNSSPSPGRGFFVPGADPGSNTHKMMSLSELMDAARGVTNMFLAHEIAVSYFFIFIAKKHFSEFFCT